MRGRWKQRPHATIAPTDGFDVVPQQEGQENKLSGGGRGGKERDVSLEDICVVSLERRARNDRRRTDDGDALRAAERWHEAFHPPKHEAFHPEKLRAN